MTDVTENLKQTFWITLENTYNVQIPNHIKNIMQMMGYGNPIAFQRITQTTLAEIEDFIRTTASFPLPNGAVQRDFFGDFYVFGRDKFAFTPGDRDLILGLVERVKEYSEIFKKLLNY